MGVVLLNVHLITGGFAFTAVSIPMVLICCHSHRSDDDRASKPTAATSFGEITVAGPPSDAWLRFRLISDDGVLGAPIAAMPFQTEPLQHIGEPDFGILPSGVPASLITAVVRARVTT